jgi:hypothetical protein
MAKPLRSVFRTERCLPKLLHLRGSKFRGMPIVKSGPMLWSSICLPLFTKKILAVILKINSMIT